MGRRRLHRTYEPRERNIREVLTHYDDGTTARTGYEVRVRGKTVGVYPNVTAARLARDDAQGKAQRGTLVTRSAGNVKLKTVADEWLARQTDLKPRTLAGYRRLVTARLAPLHDVPVNRLDRAAVKQFVASLTGKPATRRHVFHVLSKALDEAVDNGYIAANPCVGVQRPKVSRSLIVPPTHEDVDRLVKAMYAVEWRDPDTYTRELHPWAGFYCELAAHSGLRAGELVGLRVRHLSPLHRNVRVMEAVYDDSGRLGIGRPKSDAGQRLVDELPADLCARLRDHVAGRAPDAFVFGPGDRPISHNNFYRRVFTPTARQLGLTLRFHDLRHYHASACVEASMTPLYVAHRLGHADATMVLRVYGHLFPGAGEGLADRLASLRVNSRASSNVRELRA